MLLFGVLQVPQSLLLEVPAQEELLYFLELALQIVELLVVVLLDLRHFLPDIAQLTDLVLHLVLELTHLVLQVIHVQLVQHHHVVVAVLAQQTLEANRTQVVLTEGFDLLRGVDLALALTNLTNLVMRHFPPFQIYYN